MDEAARGNAETRCCVGREILRRLLVLVEQPSDPEEQVGLYEDRLPALEVAVDLLQQLLLCTTTRTQPQNERRWRWGSVKAGVNADPGRPLRGTRRNSLLEMSTTMALSRLREFTCPEVSVISCRRSRCSVVALTHTPTVLWRLGPVRAERRGRKSGIQIHSLLKVRQC